MHSTYFDPLYNSLCGFKLIRRLCCQQTKHRSSEVVHSLARMRMDCVIGPSRFLRVGSGYSARRCVLEGGCCLLLSLQRDFPRASEEDSGSIMAEFLRTRSSTSSSISSVALQKSGYKVSQEMSTTLHILLFSLSLGR